ncbi:MAG: methylmalonyl-CoA mutase family protein, partial [Candidatus Methylomirabilaceae bacterium]
AAVLGGVQSMALSCFDEALALPTEQAQRIALRTQQIIAYESGAADTVDPMAGSYYVESLTDELERRANEELEAVLNTGGAVEAIERGYMQRAIQEAAYAHQREVEAGVRVVVGVNRFQDEGKPQALQLYRADPEAELAQVKSLEILRRERDNQAVSGALKRLRDAALGEENLLPPILQAVKSYATVGEICGVLREVFGEYKAPTGL